MGEIAASWLRDPKFGIEIAKLIPPILWFVLAIIVLRLFYRPLRDQLLPNLVGFKAMGVEISLVKEAIDAAVDTHGLTPVALKPKSQLHRHLAFVDSFLELHIPLDHFLIDPYRR